MKCCVQSSEVRAPPAAQRDTSQKTTKHWIHNQQLKTDSMYDEDEDEFVRCLYVFKKSKNQLKVLIYYKY